MADAELEEVSMNLPTYVQLSQSSMDIHAC